eukprot:TRINITY_DN4199_c0_g1_i1.p1 TRINITY_DN4199_c0_g1~~TRINITY_DN4199_c0_g1_i1.p1  ORF type:complete len:260 (-),score=72.48 TRINITY_DN4199_c0_g1_i1:8-787(-)
MLRVFPLIRTAKATSLLQRNTVAIQSIGRRVSFLCGASTMRSAPSLMRKGSSVWRPSLSVQPSFPFVRTFISTQKTPNPNSLKFLTGKTLTEKGPFDFQSASKASHSPIANRIFRVGGITGVFISNDYVTVTKQEDVDWSIIKPDIFAAIMDFLSSGQSAIDEKALTDSKDDSPQSETVQLILELLETRIRPSVQEDGGDIQFKKFENGVVYLRMMGSCSGCPSSSLTLKSGIENMLRHYVPEVQEVKEDKSDEEHNSE